MKRILMALSASTVLLGTLLVPSARASVAPGHPPLRVAQKPPPVQVVHLGASFSPSWVKLAPGERVVVIVRPGVLVHLDMSGNSSLALNGSQGDVYLFTAKRAGMTTIAASVRPRCQARVCPQWRSAPDLVVTTS